MVHPNNGFHLVQQSTLTKLVCSRCKKYLSVTPIYTHITEGPVCGRCPIANTENFFRDELYENSIEYQRFPCIYHDNGCLENLFPHQVAKHEKRCMYMQHECPTRVYNNCTWSGPVGNILDHFENKHPTFILKECQFEVDFINNHTENYIMPYAEDIYVVTREANSTDKTFSIVVSYMGSNCEVDEFTYTLTLESGNRAYRYSLSQEIGKQLQLEGQIVREMLHDPVSIIANISIQETSIKKETETNGIPNTVNPDIDEKMLALLECPYCMEYMVAPIFQCVKGHDICSICRESQEVCPTCRGAYGKTQNYTLEKIAGNMMYPCKHTGCNFVTKSKNIRQHEATCLFGPFKCPLQEYENCSEIFRFSELFNHIKKQHYESLIELDTISIPVEENITEDITEAYILKHYQMLFKLCFRYVHVDSEFYWAVQLVGPPEESSKYKFELEIMDNNEKNNRLYVKMNCAPLAGNNESFDNEDHYVYFDYDQISKFIKNQLTYRLRIMAEK